MTNFLHLCKICNAFKKESCIRLKKIIFKRDKENVFYIDHYLNTDVFLRHHLLNILSGNDVPLTSVRFQVMKVIIDLINH